MDELTIWQSAGNQIAKRLPFIERLLEPQMIRRDSKAQADAITRERRAETDADVEHTLIVSAASYAGELVKNGKWTPQQAREYINFGAIVGKAAPSVNIDADPAKLDDDWIAIFKQRASSFSNEDMQDAFARLLAGETNAPGSYSRASVDTLAKLENHHAKLMQTLRSFSALQIRSGRIIMRNGSQYLVPLVFEYEHQIYGKYDLRYDTLIELQSLNLISIDAIGLNVSSPGKTIFVLPDAKIAVIPKPNAASNIRVGHVSLTFIGQELLSLCQVSFVPGFADFAIHQWRNEGCDAEKLDVFPAHDFVE